MVANREESCAVLPPYHDVHYRVRVDEEGSYANPVISSSLLVNSRDTDPRPLESRSHGALAPATSAGSQRSRRSENSETSTLSSPSFETCQWASNLPPASQLVVGGGYQPVGRGNPQWEGIPKIWGEDPQWMSGYPKITPTHPLSRKAVLGMQGTDAKQVKYGQHIIIIIMLRARGGAPRPIAIRTVGFVLDAAWAQCGIPACLMYFSKKKLSPPSLNFLCELTESRFGGQAPA